MPGISSVELTRYYLERIARHFQGYGPHSAHEVIGFSDRNTRTPPAALVTPP